MGQRGSGRRKGGWTATGWSAFESFADAAHVLAGDGTIVEANPAFERMFGGPRAAFLGRNQAELCRGTSKERRRLTARILGAASSRGSWQGALLARGEDGRRFTTRAQVFPAQVDGRRYFVCIQEEPGRGRPNWLPGESVGRDAAAPG